MKRWFLLLLVILSSITTAISNITQANYNPNLIKPSTFQNLNKPISQEITHNGPDISPFFLIEHGASLNFSPVVLIPDYSWYQNKSLDYFSETYVPEIRINSSVVDLGTLTHQDLLAVGIDWNVFGYGMYSFHNLNYT
ncbi:hypothetical protein EU534_02035, partial [Candidatus Heimdallarchaeota archaeon]